MKENFAQAKKLIEQSQTILLTTHARTDGDDLGTVLAFAQELIRQNKEVYCTIKGGVPKQLKFLPSSNIVREILPDKQFDLLIISGCSNLERCEIEAIINLNIPTLNIDHHVDNTNYGNVNIVDSSKSAVTELTYDFFSYCTWPISSGVATCLLTGIFTDTGSFMHSNVEASTLEVASKLLLAGAHTNPIAKQTFHGKNIATLKAWGKALENSFFDPSSKAIYSILTQEDLNDLNAESSAFEGLVETLNTVPQARFALLLKQDGEKVKGSLRSESYKGINVNQIAKLLGGGGHKLASGFSVVGKLQRSKAGSWEIVTV